MSAIADDSTNLAGERWVLDKFDEQIIEALRVDARQPVSVIADAINLSRSAVSERIKKLETNGVIRGYQVLLSESRKDAVSVYFEVRHQRSACSEVVHIFRAIPEVQTCHGIAGETDLLVYVRAESMQRIHEIREYLDSLQDIAKITTHVVMSEWINNG